MISSFDTRIPTEKSKLKIKCQFQLLCNTFTKISLTRCKSHFLRLFGVDMFAGNNNRAPHQNCKFECIFNRRVISPSFYLVIPTFRVLYLLSTSRYLIARAGIDSRFRLVLFWSQLAHAYASRVIPSRKLKFWFRRTRLLIRLVDALLEKNQNGRARRSSKLKISVILIFHTNILVKSKRDISSSKVN